ncbi:hypothetical protein CBM2598_U10088 [Cupriavidus taiwanensis]|nr:hypothetical protein CBM2598_U10088 [Cupriavidus taiwanensis]
MHRQFVDLDVSFNITLQNQGEVPASTFSDYVSREIVEDILDDSEPYIDWLTRSFAPAHPWQGLLVR